MNINRFLLTLVLSCAFLCTAETFSTSLRKDVPSESTSETSEEA